MKRQYIKPSLSLIDVYSNGMLCASPTVRKLEYRGLGQAGDEMDSHKYEGNTLQWEEDE